LVRAYGPVDAEAHLNGTVSITFCGQRGMSFDMAVPWAVQQKYDPERRDELDAAASDSRIESVIVSSTPPRVDPAVTMCR
jgi:hypothetical protein